MHALVRRPLRTAWLMALVATLAACGERGGAAGGGSAEAPPIGRDEKQVLSAFGDEGRGVLEDANHLTLFTLNPQRLVDGELSPETERVHGYGVLGQAVIEDAGERRRLVEAVYEGLKGEGAGPAKCWIPRHALRFVRGSKAFTILICFQCTWVYIYEDHVEGGEVIEAEHETRMLFGAGVKPVFDSILKVLKLPQDGG